MARLQLICITLLEIVPCGRAAAKSSVQRGLCYSLCACSTLQGRAETQGLLQSRTLKHL